MLQENCSRCGVALTNFRSDRVIKYCSVFCTTRRLRETYEQPCKFCQKLFRGPITQLCCSMGCSGKFRASQIRTVTPVLVDEATAQLEVAPAIFTYFDHNKIDLVTRYPTWALSWHGYAYTTIDRQAVFMHNLFMNPTALQTVDHKDGNSLNNKAVNLRFATRAQNLQNAVLRTDNTVGYKGVSRRRGKFRANIWQNGKQIHLGDFLTAEIAASKYDDAARKLFGEFARVNFPLPGEQGARK